MSNHHSTEIETPNLKNLEGEAAMCNTEKGLTLEEIHARLEATRENDSPTYNWALDEVLKIYKDRTHNMQSSTDSEKSSAMTYDMLCFESALNAFKVLMKDGHSGTSINITSFILKQLLDGKPLTRIIDTPEVWTKVEDWDGDKDAGAYQCNRYSPLFKHVYTDGKISFTNVDEYRCVDVDDPTIGFHSGLVSRILNEMFPITFPYMPADKIKVYCSFSDGKEDILSIRYLISPSGETKPINRYFRFSNEGTEEIGWKKYHELERENKNETK